MLWIKIDKKKVTKEAARKDRWKYMNKLGESISNDPSENSNNESNYVTDASTSSSVGGAINRSSDVYICCVSVVFVLALGACVLFASKYSCQTMVKSKSRNYL